MQSQSLGGNSNKLSESHYFVQQPLRQLELGLKGKLYPRAVASDDRRSIRVYVEAGILPSDVVGYDKVQTLLAQLRLGVSN